MKVLFSGFTVLASALCMSAPAKAVATYTSLLEYKDTGASTATKAGPFGKVTLAETNANTVTVTVTLFSPEIGFLNTGGPHDPFLFNLTGDYDVTVTNTPGQTFYDGGYTTSPTSTNWTATPFGDFTNRIGCCDNKNGASHMSPPPLTFSVYDANGITFAGVGALFDTNDKLFQLGTGDHFISNGGGWWFTADLVDKNGNTFNVAARDAVRMKTAAVPEPASWALMITGFGVVGAGLRRRRAAGPRIAEAA